MAQAFTGVSFIAVAIMGSWRFEATAEVEDSWDSVTRRAERDNLAALRRAFAQ